MYIVEIKNKNTKIIEKIHFFESKEKLENFLRDDIYDYDDEEINWIVWQIAKVGSPMKNVRTWF